MKHTGAQPFPDLTAEIEDQWLAQKRNIGVPYQNDVSVTGQPYVELTADAPRLDEDMAFVAGKGVFDSYARTNPGADLYWHTAPTIERVRAGRYWGYRVSMKLLISDNPIVPRLLADAQREIVPAIMP